MRKDKLLNILFIIYSILLIWIILFKVSFFDLDRFRSINIIPFYYINEIGFNYQFKEVIFNFIIFIPFGIYLRVMNINSKSSVLYGALLSIFFELSQFIFKLGATDITDIIMNTTGTLFGILLYNILSKYINKDVLNKFIKYLALIVTILFCLFLTLIIIVNQYT